MSETEWKLWQALRGGQIDGYRFRRQHPIGVVVVDFVCLEKRLIIEVDGDEHGEPAQIAHDAGRTEWLESRGYRVLRFWTHEISGSLDSVLDIIWVALREMPLVRNRTPPPRRARIT